jgi:hypothetical protein
MAAGDPIAITNSKITALNTKQAFTFMAADQDTADATQDFIYTPTGKDHKIVIGIQVADTNGAVAHSITGGTGVFGTAAKTGSTAQATTGIVQIETGRYMQADGTIKITFTPATGKKLKTDHALKVWVIELQ